MAAWAAIGYQPNKWQLAHVHSRTERFIAGCTCRQCGKTTAMAGEIHNSMTKPPDLAGRQPFVGVMATDFDRAELPVLKWFEGYVTAFGGNSASINMNRHFVRLPTGAMLRWYSAENPAGAAGPTFSDFFFDESQWISNEAWTKTRPALNAREANVFAFGTPDTTHEDSWFHGLVLRGQDDEEDHYSFGLTVWANPYITYEEIARMRSDMTDDEFRMLALNQWIDATGKVFKRYKHCFTGAYEDKPVVTAGPYVMGLDVAKRQDFTVGYVLDMSRNKVVHKFRISGLPYDVVEERVEDVARHYRCIYVHMDDTGVGDAVADHLRRKGVAVRGFTFGTKSKHRLVSNLNRMLEHGELVLPEEDKQLQRELSVFRSKITGSGNVTYASPDTYFDDAIDALSLAALPARAISQSGLRQRDWVPPMNAGAPRWFDATAWGREGSNPRAAIR